MIIQSKGDVIILRGMLTENHWPALKSVVSLLLKRHPAGVIVDGGNLTEVTQAGARTFLDASEYIESQNARVVVAGLSADIIREISGVPGIRSGLPLAATVEEARASLAVSGAEALPSAQRRPVVLMPLIGDWRKAADYAVAQAAKLKADIHLLYVIEVPRAQPLGVPLPDAEKRAERVLSEGEAILRDHGFATRKLSTRARVAVEGAARFAAESGTRLLVMAFDEADFAAASMQQDIFGAVCRDVHCESAVICVASERQDTTPTVLFPMVGSWRTGVHFVGRQASETGIDVDLLYVISVPRAMSLDASMPEQEREAAAIFDEAERSLKQYRLPVRRVLMRSRDAMEGIARHAAASKPISIAVSYERSQLDQSFTRDQTVGAICREAPADVIIICPPKENKP